jgi:hypothetical protein
MKYKLCLKKVIILLLLNVVCLNLFYSQTSEIDLHKKYWYYKSRFNNDFVSIGTNQGQSIPFGQRGFTYADPKLLNTKTPRPIYRNHSSRSTQ